MSDHFTVESAEDLMHGYLDDTLSIDQQQQLARWLKSDPQHARQFAERVLLHDRLRAEMIWEDVDSNQRHRNVAAPQRSRFWPQPLITFATAISVVFLLGAIVWQMVNSPALAANVELQRMIRASEQLRDRTYAVTALSAETAGAETANAETIGADAARLPRGGRKPSVDGARLYVRGPNQYVLVRYFSDGSEFVTGSNGVHAWAVPPRGRVRVSADPERFRGAVPGQQHAIPFVDLRDNLRRLQDAYELTVLSESSVEGWRRLDATRRESSSGGPKQVTIWYDAETGLVHRMLLERLPQARGGPATVQLQLIEQRDLGTAFFEHSAHHSGEREVIEDPQE